MKKFVTIILALGLILTLFVGCGTANTPSPTPGATSPAVTTPAVSPTTTPPTTPATTPPASPAASTGTKTVGFINIGLGSEFFQAIQDTFVAKFQAAGWNATAVSGDFDPGKQIEAIENFIAMDVDVLVIFPVDGAPVDDALKQAQNAGIKVIELANVGQNWDVAMVSDNFQMAELMNLMAAKWVNDTFPDAADKSINCVAVTYYSSQINKDQAGVALEIEKYSPKIKLVGEYQLTDETTDAGVTAAENIMTKYSDVKLIITPQGTVAVGMNNYLTSMNSPLKDYKGFGIFACNAASEEAFTAIKNSGTDGAPLRGSVMTGSVDTMVNQMLTYSAGLFDGSITAPYTDYSLFDLVQANTADEFLATGNITTYTQDDLYNSMPYVAYKR